MSGVYLGSTPVDAFNNGVTNPQTGEFLRWDGTTWRNATLPAGQVPSGYVVVNSMAQLRNLTPTAGVPVLLTGYTAAGDGGGGVFHWNATYDPMMAATITIAAAGSGYKAGVLVTLAATAPGDTDANKRAAVWVETVDGSGGVTSISIVRWGLYTVATQGNPIPTTSPVGTGFTVNATWTNTDDDGTIINPSGSTVAGRWLRDFVGPVNLKWYGVTEGTNSQVKIQKAIAYYEQVYIPAGRWSVWSTIVLFQSSRIIGAGTYQTIIVGTLENAGKPIFYTNPVRVGGETTGVTDTKSIEIRNLAIFGYCSTAIYLVEGTYSILENIRIYNLYNIEHAVICEDVWNTRLRDFTFTAVGTDTVTGYTPPSNLACLWIGRFANAFTLDNIISSSTNAYGIIIECAVGAGSGQWLRDLTLQGHTECALWIKDNGTGPTIIDGCFTEACKQSMRVGELSTNRSARSVSLRGAYFQGSTASQSGLATVFIDLAYGVDITSCIFGSGDNQDGCIFLFDTCHQVRLTSCYLGFQPATYYMRRTNTSSRPDIALLDIETVAASGHHTVLTMKAQGVPSTATNGRMARAWLDGSGVWQSAIITIPVHASLV